MDKKRLLLTLCLISFINTNAQDHHQVAYVKIIKGHADRENAEGDRSTKITKKTLIYANDIINVYPRSFLKLIFKDKTQISISAGSRFIVAKYKGGNRRDQRFNLFFGKMKAIIFRKAKGNENISFHSKNLSIAVRGTTFYINRYNTSKGPNSDILLAKGKLNTEFLIPGKRNIKTQLMPGNIASTQLIIKDQNLQSLETLSNKSLQLLAKNPEMFLPNHLNELGETVNLEKIIRKKLSKIKKKLTISDSKKKMISDPESSEMNEEDGTIYEVDIDIQSNQ